VSLAGRIGEFLRFKDGACCVEDWREEAQGFELYMLVRNGFSLTGV
jgi:hypothetical protein